MTDLLAESSKDIFLKRFFERVTVIMLLNIFQIFFEDRSLKGIDANVGIRLKFFGIHFSCS